MAVMLMRAIGLSELISSRTSFADDKDIPSWAKASIEEIRKLGIMQGRGNDRFEPGATATRAEAVVTILRLLDFIKDK
ncbi:S-layer homology domain-containing protein [Cohnella sp. LGH]|nr:S-layer homology domain-containing protein [Cohnella sp. LGH]